MSWVYKIWSSGEIKLTQKERHLLECLRDEQEFYMMVSNFCVKLNVKRGESDGLG